MTFGLNHSVPVSAKLQEAIDSVKSTYQNDRCQVDRLIMSPDSPKGVDEFPLTEATARQIIVDLAENYTHRIRWSQHVKQRMIERGVTTGQILTLLQSKRAVFREGPYPEPNGDWKFNLKGLAAGTVIELTVALKNHHDSPSSVLVTVWID